MISLHLRNTMHIKTKFNEITIYTQSTRNEKYNRYLNKIYNQYHKSNVIFLITASVEVNTKILFQCKLKLK
jgi:hypothetical protein